MNTNTILESKAAFVVIPGEKFNERVLDIIKALKNKKVCYVTLNKGADAIMDVFKKNKIDSKNFFFIDGVTKTIITPRSEQNCAFISSPSALTELSIAITKSINQVFL